MRDPIITACVLAIAALPVVGVVAAICTGDRLWLLLCFAMALFL